MANPISSMQPLIEAVRSRRQALGLRQEDLADLAACSERFVQALESGKISVRMDKLLDVMRVLGLDFAIVPGRGGLQPLQSLDTKVQTSRKDLPPLAAK